MKETKSTTDSSNNTLDNKTLGAENIAFEEEKISAKVEEIATTTSAEEKQPPEDSTTIPKGLVIEEEQEEDSAVLVASNQSSVSASTMEADSEINIQTYSEPLPPSLITNEDHGRSVLVKAQQAEESALDLADAVGAKLYSIAKEKFGKLDKALDPNYMRAVQDSRKIQALGPMVEELARVFEDTMTMISSISYKEQADFLTGYKKLIKEQINVIDSRIGMAKRLGYR